MSAAKAREVKTRARIVGAILHKERARSNWIAVMSSEPLQHKGSDLRDAAGAEGEDDVVGFAAFDDTGDGLVAGGGVFDAVTIDGGNQRLRRDALNGIFAGGVDVEDLDGGGVVESGDEVVEEVARAGIAVRLEDHMNATVVTVAGSAKG